MATRVVLADDHELVRTCIRTVLSSHGFNVVSEAADGRELLRQVRVHRPDVAVVDVSMPLLNGIEATRRIAKLAPTTRVVILTMHVDDHLARRARTAGAAAYVVKDETGDRLIEVIERVVAGEICLPPDSDDDVELLTTKEREVLQLIAEGKRNREIADIMCRSIHTVRSHRARAMRKLGARNASELVRAADSRGLLRWPV